jgi:integrase
MTGHIMKRREHGEGSILERGPNTFRLRYRLGGKRYSVTFKGTRVEARAELRKLIRSTDTGQHVAPDKMTVAEWIEHWIKIGCPNRKKKTPRTRTAERYAQLLRGRVVPAIGATRLQRLQPTAIDALYEGLAGKVAPRTACHVHVVLSACLNAAVGAGLLAASPMSRVTKFPSADESTRGQNLDRDTLAALVQSFRHSTLYPIVAVAAFTGARRNEILALRWSDLDPGRKAKSSNETDEPPKLRIERAIDETKEHGRTLKSPKTARGSRVIQIDDGLLALLLRERDEHLRAFAGVPADAAVDLSLVKLPADALMFPSTAGDTLDLTRLRDPHAVTREFCRQARKRGFARLRFHDLRGSHETILLDQGVPVHVVAARGGHDPAVLLRTYAKRNPKADASAAAIIGELSKGALA